MITITCDFCEKVIKTHDTKGVATSLGTVDIIENKCDTCTKATLDTEWAGKEKQDKLDADWAKVEAEKKNFLNSLLENQKTAFMRVEKRKHYGTLYVSDV